MPCVCLFYFEMNENQNLQRKIIKALNDEIGADVKQLYKLKELYDETVSIQSNLKEKVNFPLTV